MRLANTRIENLRAFCDETVTFNNYTCLVGPNGAGKSTVLTALNIFFRNNAGSPLDLLNLDEQDFHQSDVTKPIRITLTFEDLTEPAKADLAHYYRQGKLVVTAVAEWNAATRHATVKHFGNRLGMTEFRPYFEADDSDKPATDLKAIYQGLRAKFTDLPSISTKAGMKQALRDYEASKPDQCSLIPSEDQFYGVSRGTNLLEKYVQWVYVPAVKDASEEGVETKKTALGILLERTVRSKISFKDQLDVLVQEAYGKYKSMLEQSAKVLDTISGSLNERIRHWAHPDASLSLKWNDDAADSVKIAEPLARIIAGEGGFKGDLARFGHGLQRCYLLSLLQELSGCDDPSNPRLILGIEEPELYQHPPQQKHLADILCKLSEANAQVMACTHSPYFISGKGVEDIRLIRKDRQTRRACASAVSFDKLSRIIAAATGERPAPAALPVRLEQALQPSLSEMFFASTIIFVEGLEDVAYLTAHLVLTGRWEDFRRLGCHFVPVDGKSELVRPLAIAKGLGIPTFTIFDSDADTLREEEPPAVTAQSTPEQTQKRTQWESRKQKHAKDNTAVLNLCGIEDPDPLPAQTLWGTNVVMWSGDIGAAVRHDLGQVEWSSIDAAARTNHGLNNVRGDLKKHSMFIGYVLHEVFARKKCLPQLDRLCELILTFASNRTETQEPGPVAEPVAAG